MYKLILHVRGNIANYYKLDKIQPNNGCILHTPVEAGKIVDRYDPDPLEWAGSTPTTLADLHAKACSLGIERIQVSREPFSFQREDLDFLLELNPGYSYVEA